jgi:hypothetical protein
MKQIFLAALVCGSLAGCAASAPENPAQQADDATCTAQADAAYNAQNTNLLGRTSQNGLLYAPTNHVFDAQRMGSLSARDNQIQQCEQDGNAGPNVNGVPVVAPHIVQSP